MAENDGSATEKLTFLLIGAGIGATLALLFAPKSGRELRGDIADYTKKGLDAANEGARALGERATEVYGTASGRVAEAYGTASGRVADVYGTAREKVAQGAEVVSEVAARQKEQIAAAIEAGKQAYREEKRKVGELGRAAVEGEES
ncbi:MAG TPA: YtxH domain-containing protein [Blastocatellia bacterium]|jgi:gas vesicle protein|nr:YtxH domain-containing protein [Blastocatellia bacterium]